MGCSGTGSPSVRKKLIRLWEVFHLPLTHWSLLMVVISGLSGWWARATPLKNMSSSIGMIIPHIWENKKCSKPPTSCGTKMAPYTPLSIYTVHRKENRGVWHVLATRTWVLWCPCKVQWLGQVVPCKIQVSVCLTCSTVHLGEQMWTSGT